MSEQDQDSESQPEKPAWLLDPVTPEWQDEDDDPIVRRLRSDLPSAILSARSFAGDLTLVVRREEIAKVAQSLKDDHGFGYMVDVAGADYPDREERFEVVYHTYNVSENKRVRLKVSTDESTPVPTVSTVWVGANWPEREAYDMYGIRFEGHPDMTRILLWEGFNGFPLRKEFPVEGIDTGAAIYPEYYEPAQGPISGEGTGWKIPEEPQPEEPQPEEPQPAESQAEAPQAEMAEAEPDDGGGP